MQGRRIKTESMSNLKEMLISMEKRIADLESFINRYNFTNIPENYEGECKHIALNTYGEQFVYQTCKNCGEHFK